MSCMKCRKNPKTFNLSGCNHAFCPRCLCEYLKTFTSSKITCPFPNCAKLIPIDIIKKCLSDDDVKLYDACCSYAIVVKCLSKECPYFLPALRREGYFVCPTCLQRNCATCSNLHSEFENCGISPKKQTYENNGLINLKKRISTDSRLLLSSKQSECEVCDSFLLPREGYYINLCMHHYCRPCMVAYLKTIQNIDALKCMKCYVPLKIEDCEKFMDPREYNILKVKGTQSKVFNCRTPDCNSFWDSEKYKTFHICNLCQKSNCIPCRAIHEGQTCQMYKSSNTYRIRDATLQSAKLEKAINCYNCNALLGKVAGCNAIQCNRCQKHLCAYSGKQLGPMGCNCTQSKRCHPTCSIGCRPDGNSPEAIALREYWYKN